MNLVILEDIQGCLGILMPHQGFFWGGEGLCEPLFASTHGCLHTEVKKEEIY